MLLLREGLATAVIDTEMRHSLTRLIDSSADDKIGYKLNSKSFMIQTPITTLSPLGWVHVYKSDIGKIDCGLRYKLLTRYGSH